MSTELDDKVSMQGPGERVVPGEDRIAPLMHLGELACPHGPVRESDYAQVTTRSHSISSAFCPCLCTILRVFLGLEMVSGWLGILLWAM